MVFSTSVEVFLHSRVDGAFGVSLLHVRGGVSSSRIRESTKSKSSPRPWRCFRLLALGFTQKRRLLHVRGGVSGHVSLAATLSKSSPRPWRCFQVQLRHHAQDAVFSTSVEVFLRIWRSSCLAESLLHVRGGVSSTGHPSHLLNLSSPRPWRCFSYVVS